MSFLFHDGSVVACLIRRPAERVPCVGTTVVGLWGAAGAEAVMAGIR